MLATAEPAMAGLDAQLFWQAVLGTWSHSSVLFCRPTSLNLPGIAGIPVNYKDVASIDPEYAKNLQVSGLPLVQVSQTLQLQVSQTLQLQGAVTGDASL